MKITTVTRATLGLATAVGLAVGLGTAPATAQPAPTYAVTNLGTLGGDSFALDINLRGQITGTCRAAAGHEQAFVYSRGGMTPLGTLGGAYSFAYAINQVGDVAGDAETADGLQHAYLWRGGAMTDLGRLGGGPSQANGINSQGQVVGWAYLASGTYHAFLSQNGAITDIGASFDGRSIATDIDELGRVVGYYDAPGGSRPFRWAAGVISDLGTRGGTAGGANKIKLFGETAGWSSYADNKARPVIFRGGAIVDLGTLGGNDGSAWGINDLGRTVGCSLTGDKRWHAFLHRRGVLYDLNDLIPANAGVELIAVTAIDDLGRIVGFGCFGGQLAGRDCSGGQLRAVLLTPPFGQMLHDLIELLNRLGPRGGRANSLRATLESADRCVGRGDAACLRGPLTAFAEELQAQAGEALTEEHARLLAAAVEGLRATQEYREPEGVPARERE
jgi:probable HAF family extracellular repeat protein